jgi:hypothetical protein
LDGLLGCVLAGIREVQLALVQVVRHRALRFARL